MTGRRAWVWCVVAGVLAFVASFLFGRIPDLEPCGPANGLGAVLAFEFVRSPADVTALFGAEPCRSALIAAQRTGLLLDGLWFIPAYTAFLCLAAQASGAAWRRWLIGALLVAGFCDEVEGLILWSILGGMPGTQGQIDALWAAVHLKFALLALGTGAIGLALNQKVRDWQWLVTWFVAFGGAWALFKLALGNIPGMMIGFTGAWVLLLLVAIVSVWRPSLFAVSASPQRDPAPPAA